MRLNPEQLGQYLLKHPVSFLTVVGNETLIVQEVCQAWKAAATAQQFSERHCWSMEARSAWDDIDLIWRSGSLFGSRALLEVRIPGGKPGPVGASLLEQWVCTPQPDKCFLVILPELDFRTRQSSWFSALESGGVLIEAQPIPLARLPQWLTQRFSQKNRQIDPDALEFLVACTEGNLLAASQEVEKLCLLYPQGLLTLDQVESAVMVVSRHTLASLVNAMAQGQPGQVGIALRSLRDEGEALPLILWTLCEDWRALYYLTGPDRNQPPKSLRLWGERKSRLMAMRSWVSAKACQRALNEAGILDRMIKGLTHGDPWEALMEIIFAFLRESVRA